MSFDSAVAASNDLADATREAVERAPQLDKFVAIFVASAAARALGLHAGIVRETGWDNPHAVFAMLRAYVDLVLLTMEVARHPGYAEVVAHDPATSAIGRRRKSPQKLVAAALSEVPDMKEAWDLLSEMGGHFGHAAFATPMVVEDLADSWRVTVKTGPGWKDPEMKVASLRHTSHLSTLIAQKFREIVRAEAEPQRRP